MSLFPHTEVDEVMSGELTVVDSESLAQGENGPGPQMLVVESPGPMEMIPAGFPSGLFSIMLPPGTSKLLHPWGTGALKVAAMKSWETRTEAKTNILMLLFSLDLVLLLDTKGG
jgi:hypothetical protein